MRAFLAARLASPARLSSEGRGDTEPIAPNDTPQDRAKNRRVDIVILAWSGVMMWISALRRPVAMTFYGVLALAFVLWFEGPLALVRRPRRSRARRVAGC